MAWRRRWQPTPVLLPGKFHGWRSLVGCSPWSHEESDTTERLHFHFSLSCIGEGNGNPLQCSCLENPKDRGAWWVAVYGVTLSQTRLKWLSSSSKLMASKLTRAVLATTWGTGGPSLVSMVRKAAKPTWVGWGGAWTGVRKGAVCPQSTAGLRCWE